MPTVEFRADDSMRAAAMKALQQNSTSHRVYMVLLVVAVVWCIASIFVMNGVVPVNVTAAGPVGGVIRPAIVAGLVVLVGVLPLLLVYTIGRGVTTEPLKGRKYEKVLLTDIAIERSYTYEVYVNNRDVPTARDVNDAILYQDITRIELYEDVQAIKVYGKVHICKQPGAPVEGNVLRVIDDPDKAYRVFFLYYHDADKLVQLLSERSGVPVTRLAQCTGSLQEKN